MTVVQMKPVQNTGNKYGGSQATTGCPTKQMQQSEQV
jgi:hypothetical protein